MTQYWDGRRLPIKHIDAQNINDLDISPQQRQRSLTDQSQGLSTQENIHPAHQQADSGPDGNIQQPFPAPSHPSSTPSFVDPAILSYSKPASIDSLTTAKPSVVSPVMIADNDKPLTVSPAQTVKAQRKDSTATTATAYLTEPFNYMAVDEKSLSEVNDAKESLQANRIANGTDGHAHVPGKKTKRGRKAKETGPQATSQTAPGIIDIKDLTQSPMTAKKTTHRSKGWRQTPLVQETTPARKKDRHHRKALADDPNGWASEEATDIQDLGDFDFERNLSKFDKRRVFDDIRKNDTTADAERLVSFNRKFKPGTNEGKNLHFTENVLDPPQQNSVWKSEAGETEEEEQEESNYSGSKGSRRGLSRSRRKESSRKSSGILSNAVVSSAKMSRGGSSLTTSPRPPSTRFGANNADSIPAGNVSQVSRNNGSFRLSGTNKACPTASSFQVLAIESSCVSEFGIGEEIIAENAGRGIADAIFTLSKRSTALGMPTVLVLVGNHKTGARAVAAARHLRNHAIRVSVCVLAGEREADLLETLRRQIDMYRRSGGWVVRWDDYHTRVNSGAEQAPGVIIDSLLATHITFDLLRLDDQAVAFEMVRWANRAKKAAPEIAVMSVDIPFGIDPNSGDATLIDGAPLVLNSSHVLCLGSLKTGLAGMLSRSHEQEEEPDVAISISLIDIGIPAAAWKKYGPSSRRRGGIDWGREWVIEANFVPAGPG